MLTYLIILLDDTSVSFCHYEATGKECRLIDLDVLRRGIVWAMKENLNIQFVYPSYQLPEDYRKAIETIDHTKIGPEACGEELDVIVTDDLQTANKAKPYIWRCKLAELEQGQKQVVATVGRVERLNIVLTDMAGWQQDEFDRYRQTLDMLTQDLAALYLEGKSPQLNLLTDRLILHQMNNCGAGDTSLTLAPDGRFYVCPAFYPEQQHVGTPDTGLNIPNGQLLQLDHAPICRVCDAWQCRRCVWTNGLLTGDMNTPSHQQCVAAHLERNASRHLQQLLAEQGIRLEDSEEIKELDYLDPFTIANRWK